MRSLVLGIIAIAFVFLFVPVGVDAAEVSCPSSYGGISLDEGYFSSSSLSCMYGGNAFGIYWSKSATVSNDLCSGKTIVGDWYTTVWSNTHKVYAEFETRYGYEGLANQLLRELESKNIPPLCNDVTTPTPKTEKTAYDWNELGNQLFAQKKFNESLDAYDNAISIDPNYKWAWYNKGMILNDMGKYDLAIVVLNQCLRIDPNYAGANFEKGYALGELGRYEESIPVYLKELQLDPTDKWALSNLGWGLNELGRYEEALSYLDRSLKIDPTNTIAQENKDFALKKLQRQEDFKAEYDGWIKQGTQYLNSGNFDEAIKKFELAYKQNPNDQNLINLKADALKKKGMEMLESQNYNQAIELFNKVNDMVTDKEISLLTDQAKMLKQRSLQTRIGATGAVDGEVEVKLSDGSWKQLKSGSTIYFNEVIRTGEKSRMQIMLLDQTIFTIGPDGEYLMDEFISDPSVTIPNIKKGTFRLVTGQVPEKSVDEIKVGVGVIGIRGTDFIGTYDPFAKTVSVLLYEGKLDIITDNGNKVEPIDAGTSIIFDKTGIIDSTPLSQQQWDSIIDEFMLEVDAELIQPMITTDPSNGGCLIATATYGSELAPQVQQLRELRDNSLLQTESGTSFMNTFNDVYYSFSPIIADYERENPLFKEAVKLAITPMITSLSILNHIDMDSEAEVLGYGISLIILNLAMYVGIPVVAIVGIRRI